MVFKVEKDGVKLLHVLNFERSSLSHGAKIKILRQRLVDLPFFHSAKPFLSRSVVGFVKKLNSWKRGAFLRHFLVSRVITTAHVVSYFMFFQDLSNKNN